jgi:hypothetical protein
MAAAVANWPVNSSLPVPSRSQQQQQQPGEQRFTNAAAAHAATDLFLDCLPERRVLWRLLFKGTVSPVSPEQQQQQQQGVGSGLQQQQQQRDPMGVASALGSLVTVFAATAFVSISGSGSSGSAGDAAATGAGSSAAAGSTAAAAAAAGGLAAMDPAAVLAGLRSYQSRHCLIKTSALLRQFSRTIHKKRETYIRTVTAAVAAADAAAAAIAATAKTIAAAAAAAEEGGHEAAAEAAALAVAEAAAAAAGYVNVPRLLQGLPSAAVAAAAEAARLRVELCRWG